MKDTVEWQTDKPISNIIQKKCLFTTRSKFFHEVSTNTIERHKSYIRGEGIKIPCSVIKEKNLGYKQNRQKVQIPGAQLLSLSVSQPLLLHQMLKSMSVLKILPEHGNELICLHGEHLPNKCDVHISH
jgi:hypothetical protein